MIQYITTRINKIVTKELERRLRIDSFIYWTDSRIVLKYIANETQRLVTFVTNQVDSSQNQGSSAMWDQNTTLQTMPLEELKPQRPRN